MPEIINVTRSSLPDFEEYCAEIRSIWESHWLTNMGEKHEALEKADAILAARGVKDGKILAIPDGVSVMVV